MPQPTSRDVFDANAILSNISLAHVQAQENFIAPISPTVPVGKQAGKYFTYPIEFWNRDQAEPVEDGDQTKGSGYSQAKNSYDCVVEGFHKDVGPQAQANTQTPLDWQRDATIFVTNVMRIRREVSWQDKFFKTGVWETDKTPTNLWSDFANSDPADDVAVGQDQILSDTGVLPNVGLCSWAVWRKLREHPDMLARIKSSNAAVVTEQLVAQVFGLERLIVAKAIKTTSAEGADTTTTASILGKHFLLAHVTSTPGVMVPSAMYSFSWRGVSGGLGFDIGIKQEEIPLTDGGQRIEGKIAFDHQVVSKPLGYFLNSVVA